MDYPYEGPGAERHPDLIDVAGAVGIWAVLIAAVTAAIKFLL